MKNSATFFSWFIGEYQKCKKWKQSSSERFQASDRIYRETFFPWNWNVSKSPTHVFFRKMHFIQGRKSPNYLVRNGRNVGEILEDENWRHFCSICFFSSLRRKSTTNNFFDGCFCEGKKKLFSISFFLSLLFCMNWLHLWKENRPRVKNMIFRDLQLSSRKLSISFHSSAEFEQKI